MARQDRRSRRRAGRLIGRLSERRALERLIDAVRVGESRVLVLRGEPGVGKTVLLDYLSSRAADCRMARASGVQSEMELAFAGLHQLLAPMLDHLEGLPVPQREGLRTAFGISAEPAPDRFLVGLAVLGLLSDVAGERPLVCLVDDAQWLDRASAQVLGFVAQRLAAEPVGLVFATRDAGVELSGLPELLVDGLGEEDARALLDSELTGALDSRVRDQVVAETRGNPLALLELPRGLSPAELAGGFGLPGTAQLSGRIEESFRRQLEGLPTQTRQLLLLAAADPSGDSSLVWRAAGRLGLPVQAGGTAAEAGLVEFSPRVRFRHPLVRSAAYQSASFPERRQVHAALAEATDPAADPDRRAWHRAAAAAGLDEEIAAELERLAGRARARGGLAAAAAFLERAALLTPDPGQRVGRVLAATQAKHQAGARDAALELLALAETDAQDEMARARTSLLRGQMAFASGNSIDGPPLLLDAARRFGTLDAHLAREIYLDALSAAMYVGRLAGETGMPEVARAARGAPAPGGGRAPDLLLDGLATLISDGYAVGTPVVRQALRVFRAGGLPEDEEIRWLFVAIRAAHDIWDDESWQELAARQVQLARDVGALTALPLALNQRIGMHLHAGELTAAASLVEELETIKEATGSGLPAYGVMALAGWQGHSREASQLIEATVSDATSRGEGMGLSLAYYTGSVLNNGLGRYEDAMASAELASSYPEELGFSNWGLVELVEGAVRCGERARAAAALERLASTTGPSGTSWGLGIEARSRALLSEGDAAERLYRECIKRLSSAPARAELARARLLYGEWLRRERRRGEAREQLRIAYQMMDEAGMKGFAERARRELLAVGETVAKRTIQPASSGTTLTPQEAQVVRLAMDGLSNPEIAVRLFISARTVQHHLSNVFAKLGISSRAELHRVLPGGPETARAG